MEDVACPPVVPIAALRVDTVEMTHTSRQVRRGCFDQQVIVIGHQAVLVAQRPIAIDHLAVRLRPVRNLRFLKLEL